MNKATAYAEIIAERGDRDDEKSYRPLPGRIGRAPYPAYREGEPDREVWGWVDQAGYMTHWSYGTDYAGAAEVVSKLGMRGPEDHWFYINAGGMGHKAVRIPNSELIRAFREIGMLGCSWSGLSEECSNSAGVVGMFSPAPPMERPWPILYCPEHAEAMHLLGVFTGGRPIDPL
jgi:hypothetical protein